MSQNLKAAIGSAEALASKRAETLTALSADLQKALQSEGQKIEQTLSSTQQTALRELRDLRQNAESSLSEKISAATTKMQSEIAAQRIKHSQQLDKMERIEISYQSRCRKFIWLLIGLTVINAALATSSLWLPMIKADPEPQTQNPLGF